MRQTASGFHAVEADARFDSRSELVLEVPARIAGAPNGPVLIANLSESGFLGDFGREVELGQSVEIEFPRIGWTAATVAWVSGKAAGCSFATRLTKAAVSAALLKGDPLADSASPTAPLAAPLWNSPEEVGDDERLPPRQRLLAIIALASLPWIIGGLVVLALT